MSRRQRRSRHDGDRQRFSREVLDRPWVRVVAVVIGAFIVGYLLTAVLFFPASGSDIVAVPDLRGLAEEDARQELERHELEIDTGSALVHPEVPAGAVLTQSPLPGQEVAPGSVVRVNLSAGHERRAIPDVRMLTARQARQFLTRSGFRVVTDTIAHSQREGSVVEVRPDVGTLVELPAEIRLVISSGPPKVAVPDLVDLPLPEAGEALEALGLSLGSIGYDPFSWEPLGGIVSQQPAAGDSIVAGSAVDVTVSGSGPRERGEDGNGIIVPSEPGRN